MATVADVVKGNSIADAVGAGIRNKEYCLREISLQIQIRYTEASSLFASLIMSTPSLPRLLSICFLLCTSAALSACGGAVDASVAPMPVADCEPQACQGLRIVDSNAETFRADSARRAALAAAVARLDDR